MVELNQILEAWINNDVHISLDEVEVITELDLLEDESILKSGFEEKKEPAIFTLYRTLKLIYPSEKNLHETCRRLLNSWKKKESNFSDILSSIFSKKNLLKSSEYYSQTLFEELFGILTPIYNNLSDEMLIWNKRNKWARAVYKASDSNSLKEVIQFSDPMKFYEFENKILAAKLLFTETVLPNRILPCIFTGQLENCHIVSENTNVSFASYNKTSKLYKEVSGMYIVIASFPGDNSELSCEIGDQIKVQGCSSVDSNLNPLIAYGENCRSGASINIPFKLLRKTSSDEKNVQNISALPNTSHISVVPALSPSVSMRSSTSKEPVHTSTISEFQPLQSSLSQNVLNGTLKFKLHTKVEKLIKEFAEDFDAPVNFFLLFENHNTVDPIIAATADLVSISKPELNLQKLTEILSMYLETESQFQADINTVLKVKSLGVNFKFLTGEENEKIYFFAEKLAELDMNFCNKLRNLLKVRTLRCAVVLEKVLLLSLDNLIFWKHFLLFAEILPVAYTHLNILEDLKIDLATNDELKGLRKNLYTLLDRFFCFANVVSLFIEYTTGKKHNCDELVNVANQFFTFLTCLVKQFIAKSDSVKQMNTSATHYFLNSGAELFLERGTLSRAIEKWKDAAFIAKFQKDVINEMMANSNILCAIQEVSDFTLQLSTEWVSLWKKVYQFITSHPKNAFVDTIITSTSHLVENIENLYPNQTSELETSAIIFFLQLTLNVGNAILISKNADDSLSWFFAITNLTTKFLQLGNDLNFSNHYLKCCVLTEVKNLISLASAYENLNEYDNFESTLKKAEFLFNADVSYFLVDSEIKSIRASLLSCMGSLYWIRHNNFNAFSCHIMSCQIFKEINDYKNFIYVEGKLGLICIDVGIKILESAYLEGIDIRVFNSVKCITSVLSEGENLLDYCFSDEIFTSGTVYVVKEECIPNVEDDFSIKLSVGDRIVFIEQYEENGIKVGIGLNESNGSQGSFPLSALYDKSKKETSLNLVESLCKENFRSYSKVGMLGWKGSRMIDSKIGNSFIEKGKLLLEAVGLHQDRSFADYDAIALMLSGDSMFNTFFSLNNFEQTVKKSLSLVRSSLDIQDYTSSINLMLQIVENESFKMGKVTVLSSVKVYFVKILTQLLNYEEDIQMYTASLKRILKHIFDYNNPDLEISKKFVSLLIKEFKELSNTNTPYSKIYDYLSLKLLLNSEEQSLISLNEVENEFFKLFCTENSIDYLENASILKIWNHQFSKLVGCTICSEHNFQNYKRFISALPSEELWNNIVNVKCSSVDITQCKHQNMNSMNSIFSLHQPLKKTVVDESLKSFAHSKKSKEINSEKELEASIQKEEILKQIKNLERQLLQLQKKEVLGKEHNLEDIEELPSYVDTM
ncbi:hypothetical protein HDU92_005696 [Lobulomyces angularis]|nr:hypothetical protein HDU92_005696 [Lobulomyces angularis]